MSTPQTPLLPQVAASTTAIVGEFRGILADTQTFPSRRYAIRRAIMLHNLYGVDLMPGAVEIATWRLHLALLACVERAEDLEPLPDLSGNLKTGNTLVGYATPEEMLCAMPAEDVARVTALLEEIAATEQALVMVEEEERRAAWREWQSGQTLREESQTHDGERNTG